MPNSIAFIGIGLMGAPMVRSLLSAGNNVIVWNRSSAKAKELVDDGAQLAVSAESAVRDVDTVITMLSDGAATGTVIDLVAPDLKAGTPWLDMSSTKPAEARAQKIVLAKLSVEHMDAPVSGGVHGAQTASLAIMAGGDSSADQRAEPIFKAMGHSEHVGASGSGQLANLANQAIVAVTIRAVAEAMLLLQKTGANPSAVRAALNGGFADSTILQAHGTRITDGDFAPGGLARLQTKDLVNVMDEAQSAGLTLPLVQNVHQRFERLCNELAGGELDHSALYIELCELNGTQRTA